MWREALLLLTTAATPANQMAGSDAALERLLDRTVWIDIGLGRNLARLPPGEIAELKRCKVPTMAFDKSSGVWAQSFYAGLEMRTVYSSAVLRSDSFGKVVLFYTEGRGAPVETLHIAKTGDLLVEQTQGFRPRTFLKCSPPKGAQRKH
jgi:hypothetical protein